METKSNLTIKIVRELLDQGFSVLLHNKDNLDGYGGWFDADDKEFTVALKHHMGFEILLHEYCHFLQWKTDRKLWDKSQLTYDVLFNWINYPVFVYSPIIKDCQISEQELDQSLHDILELEHDCEKRALKLVKNCPIEDFDTDKYIRAANAYLWSYHINRELRLRPKRPIYSERVLEHMPNIFNSDLSFYLDRENLTDSIRQALLAEYE
jgi:hypothetical protein